MINIEADILPVTINDLRDKYFDDEVLNEEEERALANFDQYRIVRLNKAKSDTEFKLIYLKIQAMANLSSYRYFLNLDLLDNVSLS